MPVEKATFKKRNYQCPKCGHSVERLDWDYDAPPLCICEGSPEMDPGGSNDLQRVMGVISDECDIVADHVMPGRRFTSKSEMKREMAARGYENHVTHQTGRGTDKSKFTSSWTGIPLDEETRLKNWYASEARQPESTRIVREDGA